MDARKYNFNDLKNLVDIYALNLQDSEKLFQLQIKQSNDMLIKNSKIVEAVIEIRLIT